MTTPNHSSKALGWEPESFMWGRLLGADPVCGLQVETGTLLEAQHHHHYSSQHQSQLAALRRPAATEGSSSDFRALVWPEVQYKAVEMSFLRRGNSCVTPDMEIRKRLEVSLKLLFLPFGDKKLYLTQFSCQRQVRRYFDKADKDGNGSLTKEEWYNVLNSSGVPTTE